jgi:hypothetical protein
MNAHNNIDGSSSFFLLRERHDCPWMRAEGMRETETPEAEEDVLAGVPRYTSLDGNPDLEYLSRWSRWELGDMGLQRDARITCSSQDAVEPGGAVDAKGSAEVIPDTNNG